MGLEERRVEVQFYLAHKRQEAHSAQLGHKVLPQAKQHLQQNRSQAPATATKKGNDLGDKLPSRVGASESLITSGLTQVQEQRDVETDPVANVLCAEEGLPRVYTFNDSAKRYPWRRDTERYRQQRQYRKRRQQEGGEEGGGEGRGEGGGAEDRRETGYLGVGKN